MGKRKKFSAVGCVGPSMVLLGVMMTVLTFFSMIDFLSMKPGQTNASLPGAIALLYFPAAGMCLIAAGLFVMLFQGILWLVRRAGVAQSNQSNQSN